MKPIVTFNAGSSSLKFAVFDGALTQLVVGQVAGYGPEALETALASIESKGVTLQHCVGIGHRIVHGGTRYTAPVRVDQNIQDDLESLRKLAPLHLPYGLGVLAALRKLAPDVAHIACFDTAFHAGRDDLHTRLPLPRGYHERGYRRYGFHGLNYEHVVRELPLQTGRPLPRRLLVAHLGNGSSMCAILDGKSVETTMGFSTADGLLMGTRTGAIDPGVLIALMRDERLDAEGLEDLLYRRSGLLGISGLSSDMRELLASPAPEAADAVTAYCYQAARYAGSLAVAIGGLDAIVFTGGIGENAGAVRQKILAQLSFLGFAAQDVHVVKANEELTIARHVSALLGQ
jgi:acetate kinase